MTANEHRQVYIVNIFTFGFLASLCARTCYSCYYACISHLLLPEAQATGRTSGYCLFQTVFMSFICSSSTLILTVPVQYLHDNHTTIFH